MKVVIGVILAVIAVVAILALGEFRYRNCVTAAVEATPAAERAPRVSKPEGFYGESVERTPGLDRAERRRRIARCSRRPF